MGRLSASHRSRSFVLLLKSQALDVHSLGVEASTGVLANDNSGDQAR